MLHIIGLLLAQLIVALANSVLLGDPCEVHGKPGYCTELQSCGMLASLNTTDIVKYRCDGRHQTIAKTQFCCPTDGAQHSPTRRKFTVPLQNYIGYGVDSHMYEFPWLAKIRFSRVRSKCSMTIQCPDSSSWPKATTMPLILILKFSYFP